MSTTFSIPPEVYRSQGLTDGEYARIEALLGRAPTLTELGMFAVMWSEHCGYKYSRPVLAAFSEYKRSIEGSGLENAGVVDLGDGYGVTMKVESHNHPSAVEPYQGAATGVGGIVRDILTMGARPIALLNSLRFGPIRDGEAEPAVVARNRHLLDRVVAGIAGYGNCVGIPTVGGEVSFHPLYSGNPLVNAMCVGVLPTAAVTTAAASGVGNPVIYLGSATGRDGIHGATFASEALDEDADARRPNVQIGDPFAEKGLIEATLEALETGAIVAIQDMGAAGLTCSTIEMASSGRVGMNVNLDLVPTREPMEATDLMLSESQERMLCVAHAGREEEVLSVFRKWELPAVVIGRVTAEPLVVVTRHGETVARLDPRHLTDECPVYASEAEPPASFHAAARFDPAALPATDLHADLLTLLASPDVASKAPVFTQYDRHVMTGTVVDAGRGDAAVIAPDGTTQALALSLDGNARWTAAHPRRGGRLALAEAARNVACTGARPIAATDGLNFGDPTRPEVFWAFREAVYGLAEAAETLGTPVISGNVSLYNRSDLGEIPPTPMVGMLGVLPNPERACSAVPLAGDDLVLLIGVHGAAEHAGIGASLYLREVHGREDGYPVDVRLDAELTLHRVLETLAGEGARLALHDLSDGGLAVALAEMAILGGIGGDFALPLGLHPFAEHPSRALVATRDPAAAIGLAERSGLAAFRLGTFGGDALAFGGASWSIPLLKETYEAPLASVFGRPTSY